MNDDISKKTFEEAILELESILKILESGKDSLEESINFYERAHYLKNHCLKQLSDARLKIEKIAESSENNIKIVEDDLIN